MPLHKYRLFPCFICGKIQGGSCAGVSANKCFCGINARRPERWAGLLEKSKEGVTLLLFTFFLRAIGYASPAEPAAIPLAVWRGVGD
jgi:hypothetical protein